MFELQNQQGHVCLLTLSDAASSFTISNAISMQHEKCSHVQYAVSTYPSTWQTIRQWTIRQ
jgi:hypothetical protein